MGAGDESPRPAVGLRADAPFARSRARKSRCSVCARSAVRRSGASWPGSAPSAMGFSASGVAWPDTKRATTDVPRADVLVVGSLAVSTTAALRTEAVAMVPAGAPCAKAWVPLVAAPAAAGAGGRASPAFSPLGRSPASSPAAGCGTGSSSATDSSSESGCGSGSGSGSAIGSGGGCGSVEGAGGGCGSAIGSGGGCGSVEGAGGGCGSAIGSGGGCGSVEGAGGGCGSVAGAAAATSLVAATRLSDAAATAGAGTRHREGGGNRNCHPSMQKRPPPFQRGSIWCDNCRRATADFSPQPTSARTRTYGG